MNSLCADRPAALPPLRIQYVDYAAWERSQLGPVVWRDSSTIGKSNCVGRPGCWSYPI